MFSWKNFKTPLFVLAPMAGITTSPFRKIAKNAGADIVFSEMISADAIYHGGKGTEKTIKLASFKKEESPYILQLFGNDPKIVGYAAGFFEKELKPDGIDINLGCPAKKVVTSGRGGALLKDFKLAEEGVEAVIESTKLPVSAKLRLGWEEFNIHPLLENIQKKGVPAISVHGRTRLQGFKGEADWSALAELREIIKVPYIANGDVRSRKQAHRLLKLTKADGIMIGIGALGNPWIFKSIKEKKDYTPTKEELKETALKHLRMNIEEMGEEKGVLDMRKHFGWYFKNFPGAQDLRKKLVQVSSYKEAKSILKELGPPMMGGPRE